MSVENFEPSITKNASTADQLLKKNSLSKEQIENPEVLKEKILEKPDNKYQNHNLPEKEEENLNEIKKEQPFLNKDLHTNKDQISHEEIKLDEKEQKIFEKKEKSLKKMTILKHFFSAAPLSIFNKSDKDTKSFSNNYIVAYQRVKTYI